MREAREATFEAALAQEDAVRKSRNVVAHLKSKGLTGADIAAILDLSRQRASQLAEQTDAEAPTNEIRELAGCKAATSWCAAECDAADCYTLLSMLGGQAQEGLHAPTR